MTKKWGIRFESKRDILPNFYETYISLKNSKVVFPENLESTYYQYLNSPLNKNEFPNFSNFSISDKSKQNNTNNQNNNTGHKEENVFSKKQENNYGNVCLDLDPDNYPKKYKKFVSELVTLLNYITLSNVSRSINCLNDF